MRNHRWTGDEEKLIRESKGVRRWEEVAEMLGVGFEALRSHLCEMRRQKRL